jgi:PKD repeat protein
MNEPTTSLRSINLTVILLLLFLFSCKKEERLPKVNANFNGDKTVILAGETVAFTDLSIGEPDQWLWVFQEGVPASSTERNPRVNYSEAGLFSVQLTASNADYADVEYKNEFIKVLDRISASFSVSDSVFNQGIEITFFDDSSGDPSEWFWEFEGGEPNASTDKNPTVVFSQGGVFNVKLTVANLLSSSTITKSVISMPDDELVAYYPFNGNSRDATENGHDGEVHGNIRLTKDRFGRENSAYEFNGIDNFIKTPAIFDYEERSVSLWINPYDISGNGATAKVAITQDAHQLTYGILRVGFQYNYLELYAGGINGIYTSQEIAINQWIHLVLMRDATTTKYYVNNVLMHTFVPDNYGSSYLPNPNFIIGAGRSTDNQFFMGKIDDIRIYKKALSENEINALYRGY